MHCCSEDVGTLEKLYEPFNKGRIAARTPWKKATALALTLGTTAVNDKKPSVLIWTYESP
jgi:hypothetical protein